MPTEVLLPNSLISSANFASINLVDIDEHPSTPDAAFAVASTSSSNVVARLGFATPTGPPTGVQTFAVHVRKTNTNSGNPTGRIDLYQGATLVATGATQNVTSTSGQLLSQNFDLATTPLPNASGADVRAEWNSTAAGGGPSVRNSVDLGAGPAWTVVNYAAAVSAALQQAAFRIRLGDSQTLNSAQFGALAQLALAAFRIRLGDSQTLNSTQFGSSTVTVPGSPSITSVTAGDQSITTSFTAPTSDGGASIIEYEVLEEPVGSDPKAGSDTSSTSESAFLSVQTAGSDGLSVVDLRTLANAVSGMDSVGLTDAAARSETRLLTGAEAMSLLDTMALAAALSRSDGSSVGEEMSLAVALAALDALSHGDSGTLSDTLQVTRSDALALSETIALSGAAALTDSIAISELASYQSAMSMLDSASQSDASTAGTTDNKASSDSLVVSDASTILSTLTLVVSDALNVNEAVLMSAALVLTDPAAQSETLTMNAALASLDALTQADAATAGRTVFQSSTDALTFADASSFAAALSSGDTLTVADLGLVNATEAVAVFDSLVLLAEEALAGIAGVSPTLKMPTRAAIVLWAALATVEVARANAAVFGQELGADIQSNIQVPHKTGVTIG